MKFLNVLLWDCTPSFIGFLNPKPITNLIFHNIFKTLNEMANHMFGLKKLMRKEASCGIIVQWTILGFGEKNRLRVKGISPRGRERGTHTPLI